MQRLPPYLRRSKEVTTTSTGGGRHESRLHTMNHSPSPLPDLVHTVSRGLRRSWIHALAPQGISPHEWRALHIVAHHGNAAEGAADQGNTAQGATPLRQCDLAEALRIAPRSAAEVVSRLEDLGYVERTPHPDDKRAVVVTITDAGQEVESSIRELRDQAGSEYFASLTPQDAGELARILGILAQEHPAPRRGTGQ